MPTISDPSNTSFSTGFVAPDNFNGREKADRYPIVGKVNIPRSRISISACFETKLPNH